MISKALLIGAASAGLFMAQAQTADAGTNVDVDVTVYPIQYDGVVDAPLITQPVFAAVHIAEPILKFAKPSRFYMGFLPRGNTAMQDQHLTNISTSAE